MKNVDAPKSHLLSHEVNVELNMLRATMMNGVGREVDCRDIVTVDNGGLRDVKEQLLEKLPKPQARHSALALERDTVGCRLDGHNMSEGPR